MKLLLKFALPALALAASFTPASAQQNPELYVVMFRADWCGPCKIVEPKLQHALNVLRDPSIEAVTFDITSPASSEISAHAAFDRSLVSQYNSWYGVTGFAAIVDADTKNTLGCITMLYDADAMTMHIKNLKTYALANQQAQDLSCPQPNG